MSTVTFFPPAGGGFGSDVTVPLANASSVDVTALELVTSLTTTTAGSEASKFLIKCLLAGSQTTALDVRGDRTIFPVGTSTTPSVQFDTLPSTAGIYGVASGPFGIPTIALSSGSGETRIYGNGIRMGAANGASGSGAIEAFAGNSFMQFQTGYGRLVNVDATSATNILIGTDGANALAQTASRGFIGIPKITVSAAGTPTGTPADSFIGGYFLMGGDVTNKKIWIWDGSGTWHFVAYT